MNMQLETESFILFSKLFSNLNLRRRPEWKKDVSVEVIIRRDRVLPLISAEIGIYSGSAEGGWRKPLWEVVDKMLGELRSYCDNTLLVVCLLKMPGHKLTQWKGEHDHVSLQNVVELKLFSHGIYRIFSWWKLMVIFFLSYAKVPS